ncbi:hypothetical protein RCL1_000749 [Eukaryota sp. TZLM3-RCL]
MNVTDELRREIAIKFIDCFLTPSSQESDTVSKKKVRSIYESTVPEQYRYATPRNKTFFALIKTHLNLPAGAVGSYSIHYTQLFPHGAAVSQSSFAKFLSTYEHLNELLPTVPKAILPIKSPAPQPPSFPPPSISAPSTSFDVSRAGSEFPEVVIGSSSDHYLVRIFISAEEIEVVPIPETENALVVSYRGRIFLPADYVMVSKSSQTKTSIFLQMPRDAEFVAPGSMTVSVGDSFIDIYCRKCTTDKPIQMIDFTDDCGGLLVKDTPVFDVDNEILSCQSDSEEEMMS